MRKFFSISIPIVLCLLATVVSLCIGENGLPFAKLFSISDIPSDSVEYVILTKLRLPRTIIALAIGALLGASGIIMQSVFRNPLVEPYTLGLSGGALLGVALCMALGLTSVIGANSITFFAILGAIAAMLIVNPIRMGRTLNSRFSTNNTLLSGIMFSFVASALTTLLLSLSTREQLTSIISWSIGGFNSSTDMSTSLCGVVALLFLAISPFLGNLLNILLLGKVEAHTLGIRTDIWIPTVLILASILAAICVASAGIIAFIGMIVPHFTRILIGYDCRISLPSGMIIGATIMLVCDIIARQIIYPQELPVGVITGLIGGLLFIWINHKSKWQGQ